MANSSPFASFRFEPGDPLAAEHAAVSAFVEEALAHVGSRYYFQEVDLKTISRGQALLAGTPEQSRRFVIAAVKQTQHWDRLSEQVRDQGKTEIERVNPHYLPGWEQVWGRRRQSQSIIGTLMRRTLPFDRDDLLVLLDWCCSTPYLSTTFAPLGAITRALERFAAKHPIDDVLTQALTRFVAALRSSHDKDAKRFGTTVEQLCPSLPPVNVPLPDVPCLPPPQPAPAGWPLVLRGIKHELKLLPGEPDPTTTILDPDRFAMPNDSPLRYEHRLLSDLFSEVVGTHHYSNPDLKHFANGRKLLALKPDDMARALLAAVERHVSALMTRSTNYQEHAVWQSHYCASAVAGSLFQQNYHLDRLSLFDLLLYLSVVALHPASIEGKLSRLILQVERDAGESPLTAGERYVLSLFRAALISGPPFGATSDAVQQLTKLIQDHAAFFLAPGEAWTDTLNHDLTAATPAVRTAWVNLLKHAATATASRPSGKWLKTAETLLNAVGKPAAQASLQEWLPPVTRGRTMYRLGSYVGDTRGGSDTMHQENADCLRGLLWCVPLLPDRDQLARAVTSVALSAYKKVPGVGPRAVKVGNAAVYALSELASQEAVGQLAMLKVRVKFGTAQKEIEKAFDAAASALDLPRDQIEELGVPSYGMEDVGRRSEEFGGYRAELHVTGTDAALRWFDAAGKPLKSVPAKVKGEHKDDLKELQQSLKDIQSMLPAQRDRIDGLFLSQQTWPIAVWRERYHNHPLVGTIARRLLWCVDGVPALFFDGTPTDIVGSNISHGNTAEVRLWHPVGRGIDEVTAWRRRLEDLALTQPFKQAYREIYLLTEAERNTRTYSNRFAAHVIRQHQFHALCAARGWKNKLRLMVDDVYPPASKELPLWGLRAEFWIEGAGSEYGADTNDAGSYLRLTTDQVRFYRIEAAANIAHAGGGGYGSQADGPGRENLNEPLPLADVPELVFSEIMRDVDLFVGVASVGNDPTWQDGGPEGRYRDYWHTFSFGELSGTAATRKQVLERLVPRLKIAPRCSISDRFLVVRGDRRTYKIHLGSGNILMEPNDQYLCIVPDARARSAQDELYLPFEGDATLSIIISKALLLADDMKIKDETILRQLEKL